MSFKMTIKNILAEALEVDENILINDFDFTTHPNWDSLAALTLLTGIEDEYKIILSGSDIKEIKTLQVLASLIEAKTR
jgi:acyl carrier protein